MTRTGFFDGPLPRILAHRGLTLDAPENSVAAFRAALEAGATHLETDVRATADGEAVLVHDPRLGDDEIDGLTLAELRHRLPAVATVAEALAALPTARFNVDVKALAAAAPLARAIREAGAAERVLITSFRGTRRRAALALLPPVATSASSTGVAGALLGAATRLQPVVTAALARVDAVQLPLTTPVFDPTSERFLAMAHAAGVEVHYWVVNDPARMRWLVDRGADGVVTDRPDLAAGALR
ncbi:glycerophosphodiester phosphodiesterase family protein [Amnibacterium sp. CER49]|uniref:glycerophosphodiester phosphodiesterase family protein n=1 Tax=Amnibacterium sp. CER49 TaxID=3039161 RepID=UPI0024495A0E|nr:glycerophosphodiester phosphodiesterase family protein [Amnibacterium sp. CER49]MDH2444648.1 glycerophosphodiester phosphodiesterase family protein [Amnibacterium sp. CER49]